MRLSKSSLCLLWALELVSGVYASTVTAEPAEPAVTAPKLLAVPTAELPQGAQPNAPVGVELELTIDATGSVSEVTVVTGAGEPFDARAVEAMQRATFEPARRGTEPVAVRIRYRFVFPAATVAEPAEPAKAAPREAKPRAPNERTSAPPAVRAPPTRAEPAPELDSYEATAEIAAPPREAIKRSVEEAELTRVPGTRGDALRSIEVLPGVARTSANDGTPVLRGAGEDESMTFLNGVPVPFLYHFGGATSFFNSRLLSRVDLYPGNFSPRFGRVVGGVIDVRTRDPRQDGFHGAFDLNLIDSSLLLETPLGDDTALALAARRSNIDFVYSSLVPEDAFDVVAAPVYYDYQALLSQRLGKQHRLRLLGYGSRDSFRIVFANPNETDPGLAGSVGGSLAFHRLQAELRSSFGPSVSHELVVALGVVEVEQRFGELFQTFDGPELHARSEWGVELDPTLRLTGGLDFFGQFLSGAYRGPAPTQYEGNPRDNDPLAALRIVSATDDSLDIVRPGAYLELGYRPVPAVLLTPGVRADYYEDFAAWTVDPRLNVRIEVGEATALKAGVGRFSQPPLFWQAVPGIGNPELEPYGAWQTSAGLEQRWDDRFELGVEAFYKAIEDVVVGTEDGAPPSFVNDGRGRIYGAELSAEARPDARTFAFLAYTLSRSERSDHGGPYRLFDSDQTHILSLAASRKLGRGWEIGTRFRLVSGEPTTPVTGSVFEARTGVYLPTYGAVNSDRNPLFHQLDVRVEKAFRIGAFTLAPYLDVQNVYNAQNAEGYSYNYDYSRRERVTALGLFPNLGIRGEL